MAVVAVVIDGKWVPLDDDGQPLVRQKVDAQVIDALNDFDQIVACLGQVVRRAQGLSDEDQRRVRDFVRATLAALEATTSLPKNDQRMFERSLLGGHE